MENKIEFDLELYNSGEYDVVTRDDKPVEIAGVNEKANKFHKVIGWTGGHAYGWSLFGRYSGDIESHEDLFLIPKKKIIKGWANVYQYRDKAFTFSGNICETKEDVIKYQGQNAIGVVYIETELIPIK